MPWWSWLLIAAGSLAALAAIAAPWTHLNHDRIRELARLVPDCVALLRALVGDPDVSPRAKIVAALTLAYLVLPIDLIPDFIPVVGLLDDALIVAWALHHLLASAGRDRVAAHWHGEPGTLDRILRLAHTLTSSRDRQLPRRGVHPGRANRSQARRHGPLVVSTRSAGRPPPKPLARASSAGRARSTGPTSGRDSERQATKACAASRWR